MDAVLYGLEKALLPLNQESYVVKPLEPTRPSDEETGTEAAPQAANQHAVRLREQAAGDGAPLEPAAEQTVWVGRTHWTHFAGSVALAAVAVAVITFVCLSRKSTRGIFGIWLTLVGACGAALALRILWRVLQCRYRLTDQRLFIERGILNQTIDQTELIRVDDVRVRKTLPDRLLGLGSVEVLSTDLTDRSVVIEGVRAPESVAEHIRTKMRALRRKSLFVENL